MRNVTTGVFFIATNAVKFPSAVTQSSWALPLSYFRDSTFLPCKISRPKMNELSATVVKNQSFKLLWCLFPFLRLKLDRLDSNSIVTRELITLFYVESANQHSLQSVQPPLLHSLQYSILRLKKSWPVIVVFIFLFFCNLHAPWYFSRNEADNSWVHFLHLITRMFHLRFWETCNTTSTMYILPADLKLAWSKLVCKMWGRFYMTRWMISLLNVS